VDDSGSVRRHIIFFLRQRGGFDIIAEASNGAEAVEEVRTRDIELVLMDINMPTMNGLDAAREMRRSPSSPCIILMSMQGSHVYETVAREAGADVFCDKMQIDTDLMPMISGLFAGRLDD